MRTRLRITLAALLTLIASTTALLTLPSTSGTAQAAQVSRTGGARVVRAANPHNPLAKPGPWNYSTNTTRANPELTNYLDERDPGTRAQLGKIALTPKARWFANCSSCNVDTTTETVADYVADSQNGDPDALVQLAIFGLWPDGEVVNGKRPAMSWTKQRYKRWISAIAAGVGNARVAIILEPDLAISANHGNDGREMRDPTPGKRMRYTAWAARYLSQTLPRESIYIDAGSADWLYVPEAVRLLKASGIQYVRGFALGATHYDSVAGNVRFAAAVSRALARAGIRGKHAVIDTADNGTPFTWTQWHARFGRQWERTHNQYYLFDNTPTCGSRRERVCQTLGHRPTANPLDGEAWKLGLGRRHKVLRAQAARKVDGYLWFGRGWRWMQQGGLDGATKGRSVRMATFTRFAQAQR